MTRDLVRRELVAEQGLLRPLPLEDDPTTAKSMKSSAGRIGRSNDKTARSRTVSQPPTQGRWCVWQAVFTPPTPRRYDDGRVLAGPFSHHRPRVGGSVTVQLEPGLPGDMAWRNVTELRAARTWGASRDHGWHEGEWMTISYCRRSGIHFGAAAATSSLRFPESAQLHEAIDRTTNWLLERQQPDGHWCGELEGDTILESEFILLLAWLGEEGSPVARKSAEYILGKQLVDGGWALYPGGGLEISASVKAYFALKLTGHDPASEPLQRARAAIRAAGGADSVNSFTRFYLALLGQIPYETCPAVPPEMVLLPDWSPINIYRISAWSRTIVVPLSIMWAFRPDRALAPERGIHELFLRQPEHWPALRCPGLESSAGWFTWERFFRTVDCCLKAAERFRLRPLRQRALRAAEAWMLQRFEHSDGLGAIFPPIIWSLIALKCLGYGDESAKYRSVGDSSTL